MYCYANEVGVLNFKLLLAAAAMSSWVGWCCMRNTTNYYKFRQQVTPAALSQIESGPQQIGNLCSSHGFRLHFDAEENIYALETPNMVDMYPITMEQPLTKAFPSCVVMN